jgi:hypothetical protein
MLRANVLLLLLASTCGIAIAQDSGGFYKTSDMLSAGCRIAIRTWSGQNPNSIDQLIAQSCVGYIQGSIDAFEFERIRGSENICVPDDVKGEQAIRVFMKYSDEHPEELHKGAPLVVWEAMHQAFPCPKQ